MSVEAFTQVALEAFYRGRALGRAREAGMIPFEDH